MSLFNYSEPKHLKPGEFWVHGKKFRTVGVAALPEGGSGTDMVTFFVSSPHFSLALVVIQQLQEQMRIRKEEGIARAKREAEERARSRWVELTFKLRISKDGKTVQTLRSVDGEWVDRFYVSNPLVTAYRQALKANGLYV